MPPFHHHRPRFGPPWEGSHRRGGPPAERPADMHGSRLLLTRFVEPCTLLLLEQGREPLHGYEIQSRLAGLGLFEAPVDLGNLYRLLRAMEAAGLVESEWEVEGSGPNRRLYRLTEDGRRYLQDWAAALAHNRDLIDRFLAIYQKTNA